MGIIIVPVVCQNIAGAGSINVLFTASYNSSKIGLICDNYLYCYISQPYVEAVLFWDFQHYAGWGVIHIRGEQNIYTLAKRTNPKATDTFLYTE